jgi:hypothetical protein
VELEHLYQYSLESSGCLEMGASLLSYLRVDVIIRFQDFVVRVHRFDDEHAVLVDMVDAGFHIGKFFYRKIKVIEDGKGFDGFEPDVYIAVSDRVGNDLVALAFGKLYFPGDGDFKEHVLPRVELRQYKVKDNHPVF